MEIICQQSCFLINHRKNWLKNYIQTYGYLMFDLGEYPDWMPQPNSTTTTASSMLVF